MSTAEIELSKYPRSVSIRGKILLARDSDAPIYTFLGIPYAAPPVDKRRFQPPAEVVLWQGVRDCTEFGPACPQDVVRNAQTHGLLPNAPQVYSEDCLYLNVFTPTTNEHARLPVMVWIHGGAFVQGYSNIYDGSALAAYENVIVVTINYRVGVFGLLRTGGGPDDYHGNQGLLDQIEALRWVHRYIGRFGGDATNVTVFGESAGGASISYLLISPLAKGLFRRAICQSGVSLTPNAAWPAKGVEKYFWKRIHAMGFQGTDPTKLIQFIDKQSADDMTHAFSDHWMPSVIDGEFLPEPPIHSFKKSSFQAVDCLIGFCHDEGLQFIPPKIKDHAHAVETVKAIVTNDFFRGFPRELTDKIFGLVLAEYISISSKNFTKDVSDAYGDCNFVAPSLLQAEIMSEKVRTYVYLFDYHPFFSPYPDWVSGSHGNEIPFVFGFPFCRDIPDVWPDEERALGKTLMKYWANFARSGNPNGMDSPDVVWNQFRRDSPMYMRLTASDTKVQSVKDLWPSRMTLWNKTVPDIIAGNPIAKAKY